MGIRFNCPEGHRLNVKEHLAGRRGKCPVCGTSVQIPQRSVEKLAAERAAEKPPKRSAPNADQATAVDPLAEAPDATWYVRHADGTQYGPAPGEVFRRWLREGRVGPDSLVWREGWEHWAVASEIFVELTADAYGVHSDGASAPGAPPAGDPVPEGVVDPEAPASPTVAMLQYRKERSQRRQRFLWWLVIAVVVLTPLVVWVVMRQ